LGHNILGAENWLQIEPRRLDLEPNVDNVLHRNKFLVPHFEAFLESGKIWRGTQCLTLDQLIIKNDLQVVHAAQNVNIRIAIRQQVEGNVGPVLLHFLKSLFKRMLLRCLDRDLFDLRKMRPQIIVKHVLERSIGPGANVASGKLLNRIPMTTLHRGAAKCLDKGHVLVELVNFILHCLGHFARLRIVAECLDRLVQRTPHCLNLFTHCFRVKRAKGPIEPGLGLIDKIVTCAPQQQKWLNVLNVLDQLRVRSLVHFK